MSGASPGASPGALPEPSESNTTIRFRAIQMDIYQAYEYTTEPSPFDNRISPFYPVGTRLSSVPVVRIFGATDRGQRVVAFVHGFFPYLYIEYNGKLDPDSVNDYIYKLGRAMNRALELSYRKKTRDRSRQYIAFIVACKGIPFYGFHVGYRVYLKIYLAEHKVKTRLAELLRAGSIMKTEFEVYEDHLSPMIQFMIDANVQGCGWVEVGECLFRNPLPPNVPTASAEYNPPTSFGPFAGRTYTELTVSSSRRHPSAGGPSKVSYCALELDTPLEAILNQRRIHARELHHDFVEKLQPSTEVPEKLVHSLAEIWDDERRRCAARGERGPSDPVDEKGSGTQRDDKFPKWQAEETLRAGLQKRVAADLVEFSLQPGVKLDKPTDATFVEGDEASRNVQIEWLATIKTAFQQTGAIFASRLEEDSEAKYPFSAWAINGIGAGREREQTTLDIDEEIMAKFDENGGADSEDDESRERRELEEVEREERVLAGDEEEEPPPFDKEESVLEDADGDATSPQQAQDSESMEHKQSEVAPTDQESDRAPKRLKRDRPPSTDDEYPTPPTPHQPSPRVVAFNARNPFASPTKGIRVQFAANADALDDGKTPEPGSTGRSEAPFNFPPQTVNVKDDHLEVFPSEIFEEYVPTPTIQDPVPSIVPTHLRTVPGLTRDLSASSPPSSRSGSTLTPTQSHEGKAPVAGQAERTSDSELTVSQREPPPLSFDTSEESSDRPILSLPSNTLSSPSTRRLAADCYMWGPSPPTSKELVESMEGFGKARVVYREPHYSKRSDVPKRAREYAGKAWKLLGTTMEFVPAFEHFGSDSRQPTQLSAGRSLLLQWEFGSRPPTLREAESWMEKEKATAFIDARRAHTAVTAQIEGPSQVEGGFKFMPTKDSQPGREKQHLTVLAMELQISTRGKLLPDPEQDEITALFYCLQSEDEELEANGRSYDRRVGAIALGDAKLSSRLGKTNYALDVVATERELIDLFINKVRHEWDPEIVTGYEIHNASWGYLIERADKALSWNIVNELGRLSTGANGIFGDRLTDRWGFRESTTLSFTGRHVLAIWRILRSDNQLARYTFEHVAFHILRHRTPRFSFETLTRWYQTGAPHQFARVFEYWRNRVEMDLEMLDEASILSLDSESARVYGIDLKSVRTRGSQFKVESIMFRIAKPESFMLPSPNRVQVGKQNAAECQPLVMEPKSAFYKGPLLVLDFQSLYPSIMIAYNYCYSTCMGRVETFKGTGKLGTTTYNPRPGLLNLLERDLNVSPNGMLFVKPEVRKSLLAKMLTELLETRVMVKNGMKREKDKALLKLLNARQLALKFLANVTYGYTSATFSGRMPCVEIADAIVQTGRETLERSLETIRTSPSWGAEVVYGDTDSLFVYLPGKSKADAFRIGNEIAETITAQNPRPVKLKFEKVYLPCVLLAKKRYVGFKYEHESDFDPDFDAKGIETVRRDGIFAVQKMQESCLKILFRTSDLSLVKEYCQRQWRKLVAGDVSPQDFTYAKEVRLGSYSIKIPPPPGAAVAVRLMKRDPRSEPAHGDRVPYILIQSEPGLRQVDRALSPAEYFADPRHRLDASHYIKKAMIPPLDRIFNLVGADVWSWFKEMPQSKRVVAGAPGDTINGRVLLEQWYSSDRCWGCDEPTDAKGDLCDACRANPGEVAFAVASKARITLARRSALHRICSSCSDTPVDAGGNACESFDCPVFHQRKKADADAAVAQTLLSQLCRIP